MTIRNLVKFVSVLFSGVFLTFAQDSKSPAHATYDVRKIDDHVIHIITLDPRAYSIELVKARDQVIGRETVQSIAERTQATVSINGGFFEIGNSEDGRPSGTLMIKGKIYGLKSGLQAVIVIQNKTLSIQKINLRISLKIGQTTITPTRINQAPKPDDIVIYTPPWGSRSFTPASRKEVIVDDKGHILAIKRQGDNIIPPRGFIISFPAPYLFPPIIKKGQSVTLQVDGLDDTNKPQKMSSYSLLMGIPLLVEKGKSQVEDKTGGFTKKPHARTALGLRPDGRILIVVVEHAYTKPVQDVTLGKMHAILKEKGVLPNISQMTLPSVQKIVEDTFSNPGSVVGLSLDELANLLIELGCDRAINLDGGGSTTLFLNDHVVNTTCGDHDEGLGLNRQRPVSDAIIFRGKPVPIP